ncbi:thiol-disulfide oxidoreductase DCC family protein [Streptomyces monticola]|uniref:Thiol-disulfide oxidoreductase DCC family protein n=1 Tax=Streptomyces monticola TaxID=2666263 RepID=A0ABW2JPR3_9ACTN
MTAATAAGRDAHRVPVRRLTVLYDPDCPLCAHIRQWLGRQRQLVPLDLVPADRDEARRRFPGLDHAATLDEITVVGDGGQIYRGPAAWVVVLWALAEHRPLAHRLSTPAGARLARGAALAAAKWRTGHKSVGWGGGVYRTADGWTYDPQQGWRRDMAQGSSPACTDGACGSR